MITLIFRIRHRLPIIRRLSFPHTLPSPLLHASHCSSSSRFTITLIRVSHEEPPVIILISPPALASWRHSYHYPERADAGCRWFAPRQFLYAFSAWCHFHNIAHITLHINMIASIFIAATIFREFHYVYYVDAALTLLRYYYIYMMSFFSSSFHYLRHYTPSERYAEPHYHGWIYAFSVFSMHFSIERHTSCLRQRYTCYIRQQDMHSFFSMSILPHKSAH
jgi:hypothetical protein